MKKEWQTGNILADRFKLVECLGQGAMGTVWKAEDQLLDGEPVACKMLNDIFINDRRAIADLKREVLLTRKLRHPNIIGVYTFWDTDDTCFITMEYIEGTNLSDLLQERGKVFPLEEILPWVEQLSQALDSAHRQGILHRDVKPANILVGTDRQAHLADFGIARTMRDAQMRITGRGTCGTILFMSPEQLLGKQLDHRSDQYSLASTVYELVNGTPPFFTGSLPAQIQFKTPPVIPHLSDQVNAVLQRALSKERNERFASCGEFARALRQAADQSLAEAENRDAESFPGELDIHAFRNADTVVLDPGILPRVETPAADRLGKALVDSGVITRKQLQRALERQQVSGERLGAILVDMGLADEEDIARAVAEQLHIPFVELDKENIQPEAITALSAELARQHECIPTFVFENRIIVALADPTDFRTINTIEQTTGMKIELRVATRSDIQQALKKFYG